jgi:hypothetical protein
MFTITPCHTCNQHWGHSCIGIKSLKTDLNQIKIIDLKSDLMISSQNQNHFTSFFASVNTIYNTFKIR